MSLVEVMIALMLLGVILTSAAVAIVGFTQQASVSERRVQATATMTRLHEGFQNVPFPLTGVYQSDIGVLVDLDDMPGFDGIDTEGPIPLFEERPLVALPDASEPNPSVPQGYIEGSLRVLTDDDDGDTSDHHARDHYRIVQVVTEIDRSGDGIEDVRRLTTIVSWEWLGRHFTDRMDSERAATYFEAGDPSEARAFLTAPLRIPLGLSGELLTAVQLIGTFTVPLDQARVEFQRAVDDGDGGWMLEPAEVDLVGVGAVVDGGYTRFSGTIPTSMDGTTRLLPGGADSSTAFTLVGSSFSASGPEVRATVNVILDPGGTQEVAISATSARPSTVGLTALGLGCPITIQATVSGMTEHDYSVTATWVAGLVRRSVALFPDGGESTISPSGHVFTGSLSADDRHGFTGGERVRFDVRAEGAGGHDAFAETDQIDILTGEGGCS